MKRMADWENIIFNYKYKKVFTAIEHQNTFAIFVKLSKKSNGQVEKPNTACWKCKQIEIIEEFSIVQNNFTSLTEI